MPNWCENKLTIHHPDPALIDRAVAGFKRGELCGEFIPTPQALKDTVAGYVGAEKEAAFKKQQQENIEAYGSKDWYDFQVKHWGVKWDVGGPDDEVRRDSPTKAYFEFNSAWAPPIAFYEKLVELGFKVRAYYVERGMCFHGRFTEEDGDQCENYVGEPETEDLT